MHIDFYSLLTNFNLFIIKGDAGKRATKKPLILEPASLRSHNSALNKFRFLKLIGSNGGLTQNLFPACLNMLNQVSSGLQPDLRFSDKNRQIHL